MNGLKTGSTWKKLLEGVDYLYYNSLVEVAGTIDLERWVKSWNEKGYTQLYISKTSSEIYDGVYGYYLGTTENPDGMEVRLRDDSAGYGDTLYFPHKDFISEGGDYWLLAPYIGHGNWIGYIKVNGYVQVDAYNLYRPRC